MVVGSPPPGLADSLYVGEEVAVQQHRALAAPRSPRGVGDHGQVVAAGRGRVERACALQESVEVVAAHHDPLERREIAAHPLELGRPSPSAAQPHPGVLEDVSQLRPAVALVHWHRHAAGQVRAEIRCEEVRVVPEKQRDAVARPQAPGPGAAAEARRDPAACRSSQSSPSKRRQSLSGDASVLRAKASTSEAGRVTCPARPSTLPPVGRIRFLSIGICGEVTSCDAGWATASPARKRGPGYSPALSPTRSPQPPKSPVYATAPRMPPMMGATTGIQEYPQSDPPLPAMGSTAWAMRGPRSRAGLMA